MVIINHSLRVYSVYIEYTKFLNRYSVNVDIDEVMLVDKNKGLGVISCRFISLSILEKGSLVSAFYLAK